MESIVNYSDAITQVKKWRLPGDTTSMIYILETESGPLISESRSSVYDVMEAYDEGYSPTEIGAIYNLSSYQVKVALAYIAERRTQLEPELQEILVRRAENEQYHRALVAEVEKQRPAKLTPQRIALNKLIKESRAHWGINGADHSE
ncbi:MAG: DUF433 domain-containing protein [Caldilinea sp. CFX5]|nr:DUF433 domain-containing protein [Caldilinea sp. CFX5]